LREQLRSKVTEDFAEGYLWTEREIERYPDLGPWKLVWSAMIASRNKERAA